MTTENRRDVSTRKIPFFQKLAKTLVKQGMTPNQISVLSSVFALMAGVSLYAASQNAGPVRIPLLILTIAGTQLRLICNLIDGLMAVECGLKTKSGEIFNDVPDRVSDVLIILGAGAWAHSMELAWTAAVLAVTTAYIRTLGAAMTGQHDFAGPMAKQHRMFLITLGCVGGIAETLAGATQAYTMWVALFLVALGSLATCVNRLKRLYKKLEG